MDKVFDMFVSSSHLRITMPVFFLLLAGLLMIMSSSSEYSQIYYDTPFYFLVKQSVLAALGIFILLLVAMVPLRFWQDKAMLLVLLNIMLLFLVFMPFIGKEVNYSSRWISLGVFNFQPSELLKLSLPIFFASYFCYLIKNNNGISFVHLMIPLLALFFISGLLLMQPDFASVVIYTIFAAVVIFFAGIKIGYMVFAFFASLAAAFILVALQPYRMDRFTCLRDSRIWESFYHECYQIGQSLIAIERGGLWGTGLGESIQKSLYLPEAYTDFVFSIIVEELGSLFAIAMIGVFVYLIYNLFRTGIKLLEEKDYFSAYFCLSVATIWGFQFVFNLAVSLSYLPVTGLTLPFVSYGGSSLLVNLMLLGIIIRILHEKEKAFKPTSAKEAR